MSSDTYTSVFSWRYGSPEMRDIFSEQHRYQIWRRIWVALAEAEHSAGLVSRSELADLKKNQQRIEIDRILEIEKDTRHDVVAAIREFAEKAKIGGGKIHLGATSMDVVDNADAIRMQEALDVTIQRTATILKVFKRQITRFSDLACIGYTHLQAAEPTTVGYRLAFYGQDLLAAYQLLKEVRANLKGKGLKGAVGTAASYTSLLKGTGVSPSQLEAKVMTKLGIAPVAVSSQVAPRHQDYRVLTALNETASALAKFAGDVRILQSANVGEWSEPFGVRQVGSSAMPFKKNPINSEKICSLARIVNAFPAVGLENATVSYLERTLDDSANRRVIIPEAFLAVDEMLVAATKIIDGLVVNKPRIKFNLEQFGPFAATEAILMEAVTKGADRQQMHEVLRDISLAAWQVVQAGKENPMSRLLGESEEVTRFVPVGRLTKLLNVSNYLGDAPARAKKLASKLKTS